MYKNLVSVLIEWGYDLTKDAYALSEGEQDFYVVLQNIYFNEF